MEIKLAVTRNVFKLLAALGALLVGVIMYWFLCLNHVDMNEVGIAYNSIGGNVWVQQHPGWYITSPTVSVANVSTLPLQISIPSSANLTNSKIVRFKPEGALDYIKRQGFSYNLNSTLSETLRGYAYSGKQWTFLEIMQESSIDTISNK